MSRNIDNSQDILDSRDIIARIEELEDGRDNFNTDNEEMEMPPSWEDENTEEAEELKNLVDFLSQFCGYGGDEQWRGDWYPVTLIREEYFTEYCKELVKEIDALPVELPSCIENNIDWDGVAEDLQADYTSAEFDGVTYWAR